MNRTILWGVCFLILCHAPLVGSMPFHFHTLNLKNGLSQSSVMKVYQDSKGFMWFATRNGLNKYDGNSFQVYQHDNNNRSSLSHNHITDLLEDGHSNLWIGTISGLNRLNLVTNQMTAYDMEETGKLFSIEEWINSLYMDRQLRLWIATNGGLFYLDTSNECFYALPINNGLKYVLSVVQDYKENIWVGTMFDGVYVFDKRMNLLYHLSKDNTFSSLTDNHVTIIYEDADRQIWIGTRKSGLNKVDPSTYLVTRYTTDNSNIGNNYIRSIVEYENRLIIGTFEGFNVMDYSGNTLEKFTNFEDHRGGLGHFSVYATYVDNANTLWVGTYGGGVSYSNPLNSRFVFYNPEEDLRTNFGVFGAMDYQEVTNTLWIATEGGGLLSMDVTKNAFRHYLLQNQPERQSDQNIFKSVMVEGNIVWCGTNKGTLYRFDILKKTFSLYYSFSNKEVSIYTIKRTADGSLWVGAADYTGLCRFPPGSNVPEQTFPLADSTRHVFDSNRCFFEIEPGIYLAGTHNRGMVYYDSHTQTIRYYNIRLEEPYRILSDYISDIIRDDNGNIWVATFGGGFYLFDKDEGIKETYTTADGLADNNITSLVWGNDRKLWFSTGRGISSFCPVTKEFTNYTDHNEIQIYEFTPKGSFRLPDNRIFFSGSGGLLSFSPDYIRKNEFVPPVVFTQLAVNNKPVKIGDETGMLRMNDEQNYEVRLKHGQNNFSISYAALNYLFPNQNRYAYMLEGYDKEWNEAGGRKEAFYTNLRPGSYIFKVRASNNDGVWNEEGAVVFIRIRPPVWATWYAYLFYMMVLTAVSFAVYYYFHMKHKLERDLVEKQKEQQQQEQFHQSQIRMFTNFSHELRTPLMLIMSPIEEMMRRVDLSAPLKNMLQIMSNNTQRLLLLVNQLLDLRKNESGKLQLQVSHDNLYLFTQEIYIAFNQISAQKKIRFFLEAETAEIDAWFDRTLLEKVIFNLLSNSFKHTSLNETICIRLKSYTRMQLEDAFTPQELEDVNMQSASFALISVEDTGKGIPDSEKSFIFSPFFQGKNNADNSMVGTGIGLSLVLSVVKLHQGKIWIEDNKPKGTIFRILLPIGRNIYPDNQIISETPVSVSVLDGGHDEMEQIIPLRQKYQVLLAEDNTDVRTYIKERLEPYFEVWEAENGKTAYEKIIKDLPDLVISDIMMPEMDGLQLCSLIKEDLRSSHIPVIIITAKSMVMHIKEGFRSGADDYIVKPFNIDILLYRIHNILASRERLRDLYGKRFSLETLGIETTSADDRFMQRFFEIIEKHLTNPNLNVDLICQEIGMGRTSFYRKLRAITNISAIDLIRNKRLEIAAGMLINTDKTVSEISFLVGFNSNTYFSTCFKSLYGISALEYVQQKKKNI